MVDRSILYLFLISLIITMALFSTRDVNATSPARIPFQASGFRLANGSLISSANVSVAIFTTMTGGTAVYSESFATGLQNGYVSITMGNDTFGNPLNMNWGQTYYLAVNISGIPIEMVDTYGVSSFRQAFISTQGEIVTLTSMYTNVTNLQTSNTTIWTAIGGSYTNITALQGASTGYRVNASIGMYYNKTTTTYTGSLTSGSLTGYLAGNAICNATYLGTHFCTQEEVMETMWHNNVSTMATWTGTAWVSSGAPKYAPASTPVNDCNGWTSAVAASYLGNYWAFSTTGGGVGATINCGTSIALACCGVG